MLDIAIHEAYYFIFGNIQGFFSPHDSLISQE